MSLKPREWIEVRPTNYVYARLDRIYKDWGNRVCMYRDALGYVERRDDGSWVYHAYGLPRIEGTENTLEDAQDALLKAISNDPTRDYNQEAEAARRETQETDQDRNRPQTLNL